MQNKNPDTRKKNVELEFIDCRIKNEEKSSQIGKKNRSPIQNHYRIKNY